MKTSMTNPRALADAGRLPIRNKPARFAVGDPNGLTSNSWRVWVERKLDVYIACRDNFKETKVSLHASGRWRMGFTTEAIAARPDLLLSPEQNRAWEVWDKPTESLPQTIAAFHLYFPTSELVVRPEQRTGKLWKDVIFIEAGPPGKITILTLFITTGDNNLTHESEPGFALASFQLGDNRYAKLIAHGDPEGDIHDLIDKSVIAARQKAESNGIQIPPEAYGYFFGHRDSGARFLVGAKINR